MSAFLKPSPEEWRAMLIEAALSGYLDDLQASAVVALGQERADGLIVRHERTRVTKDEVRSFVQSFLPRIRGADIAAKKNEMAGVLIRALGADRAAEVVAYATQRLSEYEESGGTIEALPPTVEVPDLFDLSKAEWWCKPGERGAHWPVVGTCKVDNVSGSTFRITSDVRGGENFCAYFVERDGRLIGGGFDGMGDKSSATKTWGNAKSGIPGRYGPGSESADREKVRLRKGDKVVLCVGSANSKTRSPASNVVVLP